MTDEMKPEEMFWQGMDKKGADQCWEWQGRKRPPTKTSRMAYGLFNYEGKQWTTHRLAYYLTHGPIPEGMCVCHSCDNPPCCNPAHLWLGTRADNNRDMMQKGRNAYTPRYGEDIENHIFTEQKVRQYRQEYDELVAEGVFNPVTHLAIKYGYKVGTMHAVISGRTWKHVPPVKKLYSRYEYAGVLQYGKRAAIEKEGV